MVNPIEEYIKKFPEEKQIKLNEIKKIIEEVLPDDTIKKMGYGMPNYYLNGNLVYFAGFKNHIGFFPTSKGIEKFQSQFAKYHYSKGGVQFKYEDPLPKKLIQEVVKYRIKQNTK